MQEIIKRMQSAVNIQYIGEDIMKKPIEQWPKIHTLIAFQSKGYPLHKVAKYVQLNNCCVINGNIDLQKQIMRRDITKKILEKHNIDQAPYIIVHRTRILCDKCKQKLENIEQGLSEQFNGKCTCLINQYLRNKEYNFSLDNCIDCQYEEQSQTTYTIDGIKQVQPNTGNIKEISVPLLEKPMDSDDHNINFYKKDKVVKLFRKIENKCSDSIQMDQYMEQVNQDKNNYYQCIYRGKGCFVYEQFYESNGEDLKVYAIYPNYFLCEKRKAPYVDGVVQRDPSTGKEIRFQIKLKSNERTLAARVCIAFQQLICGFDIVRTTDGRSLVIDCNGFSFVKCNQEYYEISSKILTNMVLQEEKRFSGDLIKLQYFDTKNNYIEQQQDGSLKLSEKYLQFIDTKLNQQKFINFKDNQLDQRALIDVIRHGDRTIKFEYEFQTKDDRLIKLFYSKDTQNQDTLSITNNSYAVIKVRPQKSKQRSAQLLQQLQQYLNIIAQEKNVQINCTQILNEGNLQQYANCKEIIGVNNLIYLLKNQIAGTKITIFTSQEENQLYQQAKIIVKWSGQLTVSGLRQCYKTGRRLRQKYFDAQLPNIKLLHSSKRLALHTGQYILLGFLSQYEDVEEILPFLKEYPYTDSSFMAPDLFKYLQEKYPNNQKIYFLQNYTVQEFQTFFVPDEDQILITCDENMNDLMQTQHKLLNELLMQSQDKYAGQNDLEQNKIKLAMQPCFEPLLQKFQLKEKQHPTHYQILNHGFELLTEIIQECIQKARENGKPIKLIRLDQNDIPQYSDQSMEDSIKCLFAQFKLPTKQLQFNIAKIVEIVLFIRHIQVHHSDLIQNQQKFRECYNIFEAYSQAYQKANFGTSQLLKRVYGQAITFDLLNSIQDDISTTYQYNRDCDETEKLKLNAIKQQQQQVQTQDLQSSETQIDDNNQVAFAKGLKRSSIIQQQQTKQQELLEEDQRRQRLIIYVTNEVHMHCIKNLLSASQNNDLTRFMNQTIVDNFQCNFVAEMQFIYYEIKKKQQQLDNEVHRLVEIKYTQGTSSDIFQPCEYNCLPCDEPETMFSLFPFISIATYNTQLKKLAQSKDYLQYDLIATVGVYRHGDRCPKQKLKVNVEDNRFFYLIVKEFNLNFWQPQDITCKKLKMQPVLEYYLQNINPDNQQVRNCYEVIKTDPPALKIQVKFPLPYIGQETCQLIVKYGGTLTELGEKQSELAASLFYEQLKQEYQSQNKSLDMLTDFIKNIKVYTNDEERVQMTEQHFVQKLAQLQNIEQKDMKQPEELQEIIEIDQRARTCMNIEKERLMQLLTHDFVLMENEQKLDTTEVKILKQIDTQLLEDLQNPYYRLKQLDILIHKIICVLENIIQQRQDQGKQVSNVKLSLSRFKSILDVYIISTNENEKQYNVSKVIDLYDLVRFEALHPCSSNLQLKEYLQEAYQNSKFLSKISGPLEFGTTVLNRQVIASLIIKPTITHMINNLLNNQSALYFVSESHIAALINLLEGETNTLQELDFMAYVNFLVYKQKNNKSFRIEVYVSRGSYQSPFKTEFCVPRLQLPHLISDNWSQKTIRDLLVKVNQYTELCQERLDLGFGILN